MPLRVALIAGALAGGLILAAATGVGAPSPPGQGVVTVDLRHPVNAFRPDRALGAGLDGHERGDTARIYTRRNVRAMLGAGLGAVSYRLRTELAVEAWHWNPRGHWSDPAHHRGYWTSSAQLGPPIQTSYGYRLPRRGNTGDQANDDGYSRLDDGNVATFWKSNPYLGSRMPQWMVVDLGRRRGVDALRIDWGAPFARRVRVEYWTGTNALLSPESTPGHWATFPRSRFVGHAGRQSRRLASRPLRVRYVRVVLRAGSLTAPRGASDPRDRLGFAVRELYLGRWRGGRLIDLMRRGPSNTHQSVTFTSSTDPWHRASDLDPRVEQPGLDRVFASGLTRGLPALVPVALLYGTPADAAAELRYLRARHFPISGMELGEEPDGQLASPQDYAALYVRWARALHAVNPHVRLGGPGFQTSIPDWIAWPDRRGSRSWTGQFVDALRAAGRLRDLGFFSFEWYPFDNVCAPSAPQLARAPALLAGVVRAQWRDGLPRRVPMMITEYGYSAFAGRQEVDMPGALLGAETPAEFLTLGGRAAYLYGYEPDVLIRESAACPTWGNLILFQSAGPAPALRPVATYRAARLLTRQWAQPGDGRHLVYRATADVRDPLGRPLVRAYAVVRPDGRLAILLVNADPTRAWTVRVVLEPAQGPPRGLSGPVDLFRFSGAQYRWHPGGDHGYARPDRPPAHLVLQRGGDAGVPLPPESISVVRSRLS